MLQATSAAIITTIIPRDRQGSALGTLGILMGLGPVLGPSVGGALISLVGWRWIFWINIPIVLIGLMGSERLRRVVREAHNPVHLNVTGNLFLSLSVLAFLESLSMWSNVRVSIFMTMALLVLFVVLIMVFVVRERQTAQPIMDLRLFRKGDFTASVLAVFFFQWVTSLGFHVPLYFLVSVPP